MATATMATATEMDRARDKASSKNPNAEYHRNFYAYYRQPPNIRFVIDRFIIRDSKINPQEFMKMSFKAPLPFNGEQQIMNYTEEQQREADAAAAAATAAAATITANTVASTASQGEKKFSAVPSGGKRKSKKYRYKKTKKSKTNKRRRSQSKSNKRSRK